MIPNFTFLDPTFFSVFDAGSVTVSLGPEDTSAAISFLIGRYGPASGWQDFTTEVMSFSTGSHTINVIHAGTFHEDIGAQTSFHQGTYTFALVDGGTFADAAVASASFDVGTHFLCAVVTDFGTESMPMETTFFEGAHNEIALGPTIANNNGTVAVFFGSGSYYDALPNIDPMDGKAVIRFAILPGSAEGVLEYTSQGNPVAYNTDYPDQDNDPVHYIVVTTPNNDTILFDTAWAGTSFDNRYQLLFDAPTFPAPSGAPPGIVIISNGTGTNVGSLVSEHMDLAVGFATGTYFQVIVAGTMPRETVPNFCTFLYGSHTFVQQTGSVTEDHGAVAATFGTGSYVQKVITAEINENGAASATFLAGAHVLPEQYVTADSTQITADCGTITADNCAPFSFDNGNWPTFDEAVVFNFSQL